VDSVIYVIDKEDKARLKVVKETIEEVMNNPSNKI